VPTEVKSEWPSYDEVQRHRGLGRARSRLEAPEVLRAPGCRFAWWSSGFGLGRLVSVGRGGVVVDGGLSRY
jgi:hypothetical protein